MSRGGKRPGAGSVISEETKAICQAYEALVASGGDVAAFVGEWSAALGIQRPAVWKRLRNGGAIAAYQPRREGGKGRPLGGGVPGYTAQRNEKALAAAEARDATAKKAPRVHRDPCPRCGVRSDIGCEHSQAPLGVLFG